MDKHKPLGLEARALGKISDGIERRRERRKQARDLVYLVVGFPCPQLVEGRLVDVSDGGFRAVHNHMRLAAGEAVQYFQSSASGTARVVWSRISNEVVETGFQVLDRRLDASDSEMKPFLRR